MDTDIIERDVVLIGKTEEGNDTFDLPVTRLGNIEDSAEVKENPETNDYFPVIDMSDHGKMKKTSLGRILTPLNEHIGDDSKHVTPEEKSRWDGKASGDHNHDGRYYTKNEVDGKFSGKSDKGHTHVAADIGGLPSSLPANGGNADTVDGKHASDFAGSSHGHSAATQSTNGFMSTVDKKKLDGIAEGANAYTHPTYTARTGEPTANQTPSFGGTFSISQPVSDGSGHITGMNSRTVKIPNNAASASAAGLMSAADKSKLNEIKVSGINVTYGKETISKATTGPISKTVTISHKTDIVFLWVLNNATYRTVIVLNSYAGSENLAGSFTVNLSQSTNSAALEFTGGSNLDETVYYAAFRMS